MGRQSTKAILGAAILASTASAQFWTLGHSSLLRSRIDPIVSPGGVAGHVHLFAGTSAVSADMTYGKARAGKCTTNQVKEDMSAYWSPQLYYKHRNGTYQAVAADGANIYWLYRGVDKEEGVAELPSDFRMIAGDLNRNHDDISNPAHTAVDFPCFGFADGSRQENLRMLPTERDCPTIRPQIVFPNCWNGVDSYKADNSHVAYPVSNPAPGGMADNQNGKCPEGFVKIPTLFLENYYHPSQAIGADYEWYPGCLVFANGDNTGLTFHADWLNGFPPGMLKKIHEECPTMGPNFRDCPYMAPMENFDDPGHCSVLDDPEARIVDEAVGVDFALPALPGNNPEYDPRQGPSPRKQRTSYVERANFVRPDESTGGTCRGNTCTDYTGPSGASPAESVSGGQMPGSASPSSSSEPVSASSSASPFTRTLTSTRSFLAPSPTPSDAGTVIVDNDQAASTIIENIPSTTATSSEEQAFPIFALDDTSNHLAPAPVNSAVPVNPPQGAIDADLGDDEELVCFKRKRQAGDGLVRRSRERGRVGRADRW